MATAHIIIGFGGTGARVLESAAMLRLSGMGPPDLRLAMIDSDAAHGNKERTAELLTRYRQFRQCYYGGGAHSIDPSAEDAPDFARLPIAPLLENRAWYWGPSAEQATLHALCGDDDNAALLEALFQGSASELHRPIGQGFQSRVPIAAASFACLFGQASNPVLARLRQLQADPAVTRIRLLLVGSAYGGAGVGGMMALLSALAPLRARAGEKGQAALDTGVLLLPPSFASVIDDPEPAARAKVAAADFDQFRARHGYPETMLMGAWPHCVAVTAQGRGGRGQCNPAMAADLIAAAQGFAFLNGGNALMQPNIPLSADWNTLPLSAHDKARVMTMLRTAYLHYHETQARLREKAGLFSANWALAQAGKIDRKFVAEPINLLVDVSRRALEWAGSVQRYAAPSSPYRAAWVDAIWRVSPLESDAALPNEGYPRQGARMLNLALTPREIADGFDGLITGPIAARLPHHAAVLSALKRRPVVGEGHKGIGRALVAVHHVLSGQGAA